MNANINFGQLVSQITSILTQIVQLGLLLLIAVGVLSLYGVRIPAVPVVDFSKLVWADGTVWLFRGGRV